MGLIFGFYVKLWKSIHFREVVGLINNFEFNLDLQVANTISAANCKLNSVW